MQLFTTRLTEIEEQIQALQAEQNKFLELENASTEAIDNLMAIVANLKGDEVAISTLKSAVINIFGEQKIPELAVELKDVGSSETSVNSRFGTSERPCPATTTGECINPECKGETFTCKECGEKTPYCYGGDGDEVCNDCWSKNPPPDIKLTDSQAKKLKELKKNLLTEEPKYFSEPSGQLTILTTDEPPDPDDFNNLEDYELYYGEWAKKYPQLAAAIAERDMSCNTEKILSSVPNETNFIHEFDSVLDAQSFIELCVSNAIACDDYHLENRIVTVINHKETCQTFLELIEARDISVKTEVSSSYVCDDKYQASKLFSLLSESDLITHCQVTDDGLAVEFKFMRCRQAAATPSRFAERCVSSSVASAASHSNSIGKLIQTFEETYTFNDPHVEIIQQAEDDPNQQVTHERELGLPILAVKITQLVKQHYHKVEVKESRFIGSNPHQFSESQLDEVINELNSYSSVQLSEQVQWNSKTNILYIWFKFKKTLNEWADNYNVLHEDAIVRDGLDTSRVGFKYLLTVLRAKLGSHDEWAQQQAQFDFSKTPEENRQLFSDADDNGLEEENLIRVNGKVHEYFDESVAAILHHRFNSSVFIDCQILQEYHGYTIHYQCLESDFERVQNLIKTVLEEYQSGFCWINEYAKWLFKKDTLIIYSKYKKNLNKWAEYYQHNGKEVETKIMYDTSVEGCKYRLEVHLMACVDHNGWALEQAPLNFAISPKENREILEPLTETELLESLPQTPTEILEPLSLEPTEVKDMLSPFTFLTHKEGWTEVFSQGNLMGRIYLTEKGWELEDDYLNRKFDTREEAAAALVELSIIVA